MADVLVACEMSGVVRDAMRALGIDVASCDLLPSLSPGPHIVGDAVEVLRSRRWSAVIAFPPCTHLAASGARHFAAKRADGRQAEGVDFFMAMTSFSDIWAIENPVGVMSTIFRRPDQIIQPWQFGHGETKATCLWLRGLPRLVPTEIVFLSGRDHRIHRMPPSADRAMLRSLTYAGVARAMASDNGGRPYAVNNSLLGCVQWGTSGYSRA